MQFEEKDIAYPPVHPGTDRTFIRFYGGEPDLNSIFYSSEEENSPQRIFVTDTNVASLKQMQPFVNFFRGENYSQPKIENGFIGTRGKDVLLILGSGEPFKTIESVLAICKAAIDSNAKRSAVFTGIGGGVITDMTAFAASIFKRGATCELVPTTLLSMVDAAIGGKTGCDFDSYKNMIGSFFPAQKIHIIPSFIQSLPENEYRSGMAEVVKTALLYSKELFEKLASKPEILQNRKDPLVEEMIKICVNAKAAVVEQDLTEKNIRMQLNLGHTFGHALETRAGLGKVSHGDAVAWGIARAAELSKKIGLCTENYVQTVKSALSSFGWETQPMHSALNGKFASEKEAALSLFEAMKKDKKNASNKVRFVLQEDVGETVITEVDEKDVLSVL
ncbi:3-dehydroquinate synthase [Treponema berlinense]|uniref:3-dehydroquinate synthase n=1 Tax=Treponema berlinense TaxID=225004 RepID=A0A1T4NXB8_9SPIR|nr:3-dehydroquinate synthase family protein [Treponema berlinense]MDY3708671.1 3-dehydroquinate synthase family protein [Treponema berlinense]SJZ83861.1 3-dehydroquinate synthase [Treponema berlinense]